MIDHLPSWRTRRRMLTDQLFRWFCRAAALSGVLLLIVLLTAIALRGVPWLTWEFLTSMPSRMAAHAGIQAALAGSLWLIGLTALIAVPIGVGAAIYLEEMAAPGRISTWIAINIANLAGVPSIVYGMLGLALFVRWCGADRSVLSGALTMTLVILPILILASREALRAVPRSIRYAAYALGATQWQTIAAHVLPAALPGIMTGIILSISRAVGEAAPLIMIGALTYVAFSPMSPLDPFTALPIQIFNWASRPQTDFHDLAAAGILVLLTVLLSLNGLAVSIRSRYEKKTRW